MWLLRLIIFPTLPLALARNRFNRLPSLAYISTIRRSELWFSISLSALEFADFTTLATFAAAGDVMNSRMLSASSMFLPLTRFSIGKSFFTDIPVSFDVAVAGKLQLPCC